MLFNARGWLRARDESLKRINFDKGTEAGSPRLIRQITSQFLMTNYICQFVIRRERARR